MAFYQMRLDLSLALMWEPQTSPSNETTKSTHLEGLTLRNKMHYAGKSLDKWVWRHGRKQQ